MDVSSYKNSHCITFLTLPSFLFSLCSSPPLSSQGLESCLKGPDNYNSQVLIEATVIALTKLQPLLSKVCSRCTPTSPQCKPLLRYC